MKFLIGLCQIESEEYFCTFKKWLSCVRIIASHVLMFLKQNNLVYITYHVSIPLGPTGNKLTNINRRMKSRGF